MIIPKFHISSKQKIMSSSKNIFYNYGSSENLQQGSNNVMNIYKFPGNKDVEKGIRSSLISNKVSSILIGINNYDKLSSLYGCINDVNLLSELFSKLNISVEKHIDINYSELHKIMKEFISNSKDEEKGIIFHFSALPP